MGRKSTSKSVNFSTSERVQHWHAEVTFERLRKPKVGIAVSNTAKMAPIPPIVMIRINLRCYSIE